MIVVMATHYVPAEKQIFKQINDDLCISLLHNEYDTYTHVIGVVKSPKESRDLIDKKKKRIVAKYGERGLDEEDEEGELHGHWTFSTSAWHVSEGDKK